MITLLRKLRSIFYARRLRRHPGTHIAGDSKINYSGVRMLDECQLVIGHGSIVEGAILFDRQAGEVSIGDRSFLGASTIVCAEGITIGNDVLVSWGCTIIDHDSHSTRWSERAGDVLNWYSRRKDWKHVKRARVYIEDRVWIGFNSIVLKGVTIGKGSVVGAGSVVTGNVPPYSLYAGNPARMIRELPSDER